MALMQDPATRDPGPSRISSGPDYAREAEDARLKIRSDEFLADSSRLHPRAAPVGSGPRRMGSRTRC
jgi:hypothetical protein